MLIPPAWNLFKVSVKLWRIDYPICVLIAGRQAGEEWISKRAYLVNYAVYPQKRLKRKYLAVQSANTNRLYRQNITERPLIQVNAAFVILKNKLDTAHKMSGVFPAPKFK
jgi:hypothetical protein